MIIRCLQLIWIVFSFVPFLDAQDTVSEIEAGQILEGEITQDDSFLSADELAINMCQGMYMDTYRFVPTKSGFFTIDLQSREFDAYLRLKNEKGILLQKNDDGPVWTDSQIRFMGSKDSTYWIQAGGRRMIFGSYTLEVHDRQSESFTEDEKKKADIHQGRIALDHCRGKYGTDHPNSIECMNQLAMFLGDHGIADEAGRLCEQILECSEKTYGPEHIRFARALSNYALYLYEFTEQFEKAFQLLERAQRIAEFPANQETQWAARIFGIMGQIYLNQEKWSLASTLLTKAVVVSKKKKVEKDFELYGTLSLLGEAYAGENKNKEASKITQEALEMAQTLYGPENLAEAQEYANLGLIYKRLKDWPRAREACEKCLLIRKKILGKEHLDTIAAIHALASVLSDMGLWNEAVLLMDNALLLCRKSLGEGHYFTARVMYGKGIILLNLKNNEDGISLLEEALALQREILGKDHPETKYTETMIDRFRQ